MMLFAKSRCPYKRDPWINIAKMSLSGTQRGLHKTGFAALVDRVVASATPRLRNRFTVWKILTLLYCSVLYCSLVSNWTGRSLGRLRLVCRYQFLESEFQRRVPFARLYITIQLVISLCFS